MATVIVEKNVVGGQADKDDVDVVIMHDSGSRYDGKIFNDDWMRQRGFLDREKAIEILNGKDTKFISINKNATIGETAEKMTKNNVSQLPVMDKGRMIGSISDKDLFNSILHQPDCKTHSINGIMRAPFPEVDANTTTEESDINPFIFCQSLFIVSTEWPPSINTKSIGSS